MKHFFLIGYYGFNNTGDEVCLQKTKEIIIDCCPDATFSVLGNIEDQKRNIISRFNLKSLIKSIESSDKVVFGGGGLLQSKTSVKSLYFYLFCIIIAVYFKKKILFLGQGIGPIRQRIHSSVTKLMLSYVSKLTVRSEESATFVKDKNKYRLVPDLAFYNAVSHQIKEPDENHIGVNVRVHSATNRLTDMVLQCQTINTEIHGISFCPDQDTNELHQLGIVPANIKLINQANFYTKSPIPFSFIFAMRYHCCVWAILQGIPFIALVYDPKVKAIAQSARQPMIDFQHHIKQEEVDHAIQEMKQNKDQYRKYIEEYQNQVINQADEHRWVLET